MTDLKTISISDLKAIIDYCGGEKTRYRFYQIGETEEDGKKREEKYNHIKNLQCSAESELSLRLGIQ